MSAAPAAARCVHRWPRRVLAGDYLRAGAGFTATALPLSVVEAGPAVLGLLAVLALLFAWLGLRALSRQLAPPVRDADGLRLGRRHLRWDALTRLTARRFGARRKDGGYVEMTLRADATRITLDSQVSDFLPLFRAARDAAAARGIPLDDRTRAALAALGL